MLAVIGVASMVIWGAIAWRRLLRVMRYDRREDGIRFILDLLCAIVSMAVAYFAVK